MSFPFCPDNRPGIFSVLYCFLDRFYDILKKTYARIVFLRLHVSIVIWRRRFFGAKRPWLSLWESWLPHGGRLRGCRTIEMHLFATAVPSQSACSADSSPIGRAKVASLQTICGVLSENGAFFVISTLHSSIFTLFCKPQILDITYDYNGWAHH